MAKPSRKHPTSIFARWTSPLVATARGAVEQVGGHKGAALGEGKGDELARLTAARPQGLASTSATLPSKSVVRTCVELSGTTVFMTPVPSLCSHLIAPVLASRAKSKPFLVP